ncbi:MAG: glutamate-5-semialdehyde dehydrogenase [Candidatus Omnitrophica bacterium]|nr:glutamate-5-semialdehyde dehydrogenase [Candidatus Omnitrophota bacterium]
MKRLSTEIIYIAEQAKRASEALANLPREIKNGALLAMAKALRKRKEEIIRANKKDLELARGKGSAFIQRLILEEKGVLKLSEHIEKISQLDDPIGETIEEFKGVQGLHIKKVRVPIGVVAIIYESRPDVTSDCAALCVKSGNAVILKGGKESLNSNIAIANILTEATKEYLPEGAIALIPTREREAVDILLGLDDYIDLVIPRGGESLIKKVVEKSRIPVIKHYKGVCHIYVDEDADLNMAQEICYNAKVQKPATCNAMETLLVHSGVAVRFLPLMVKRFQEAGVEVRGCEKTRQILDSISKLRIKPANEDDWQREYLDLIISIKIVQSLEEAIEHIRRYGTKHSDAIISENKQRAEEFLKRIDSACLYWNASTRFTDGEQFGMGAEMGISTDKIHCRGPMALRELTSYKYLIYGKGQVRK